jgi:hypothetical protein
MMTLLTLLACVADGAIVGAVIGGLLGYYRQRRRSPLAHERERVRRRYTALLDQGFNAPLSAPEQREILWLSQRWCELGLPQTPLGAPFPERQMSRARWQVRRCKDRRPGLCVRNRGRTTSQFLHTGNLNPQTKWQ